jgi:hypothetical protein
MWFDVLVVGPAPQLPALTARPAARCQPCSCQKHLLPAMAPCQAGWLLLLRAAPRPACLAAAPAALFSLVLALLFSQSLPRVALQFHACLPAV